MSQDWYKDEWIEVFETRGVWDLTLDIAQQWILTNAQFFGLVTRHVPKDGSVLELGCGPGRHAISLALQGFRPIGLEHNPVIVAQAQRNAVVCGVEDRTTFVVGDMNKLGGFKGHELHAVTHGGLMEHLESKEAIRASLAAQLEVAPLIIFDVPFNSEKNLRLFARDNIFRQLWAPDEWLESVLAPFEVREWHIEGHDALAMTDDLVVAISTLPG